MKIERFNDTTYKDVYKYFDALDNPLKGKIPIAKNYPHKNDYTNLCDGRCSKDIRLIMDKKDFEKENYIFLELNRSYFDLTYIKELDALCIREYNTHSHYGGYSYQSFKLQSAKMLYKDKTVLHMHTAYVSTNRTAWGTYKTLEGDTSYDKPKSNFFYMNEYSGGYMSSNIFVDEKNPKKYEADIRKSLEKSIEDYYHSYMPAPTPYARLMNEYRIIGVNGETWQDFAEILSSFYGGSIKTIASGRIVDFLASPNDFTSFLYYKEPKKRKNVNDSLLTFSLPDISYEKDYNNLSGFVQKINEDIAVLRIVKKDDETKKCLISSKFLLAKIKYLGLKRMKVVTGLNLIRPL